METIKFGTLEEVTNNKIKQFQEQKKQAEQQAVLLEGAIQGLQDLLQSIPKEEQDASEDI